MENLVWQDDFKDKQGNTRYEIKYDCISPTTHKSKLNLFLEDTSKDLLSILRNLRGLSIKEIPNVVRNCSSSFLRKILTRTRTLINIYVLERTKKRREKKDEGFHLQLLQDISTAASIAYASTYMLVIFQHVEYGWHWPHGIFPARYI